ncbi:hypothetical protein PAXRUDRAFT_16383 [Paxillus rubicundulus Ve08.2h10]|uniref:Uncharacterized protein n=1 Tax=Paxillus rubicundulus Ve08.2h10 TaxID=930991 RepID=A0A0D0DEI9_9AGAM|nr:hypothetical protein PAXRUDRAFT_16383 [Paxillus rubicundulus Ve08.2h10]
MKRVDVLKEGLSKLHNQIWDRKTKLEIELKAGQIISEADQDWLDGDGNLVDDERVVEALDNASDYEQGLEGLNSQDKLIVEKLQKLAGKGGIPSNKRKCSMVNGDTVSTGKKPRPLPKKKENATLQQQIDILDWHQDNKAMQKKRQTTLTKSIQVSSSPSH